MKGGKGGGGGRRWCGVPGGLLLLLWFRECASCARGEGGGFAGQG